MNIRRPLNLGEARNLGDMEGALISDTALQNVMSESSSFDDIVISNSRLEGYDR